jgi:hypothetical protein
MFPKVRLADHCWSAEIFNFVLDNENGTYFKLIYIYKSGHPRKKIHNRKKKEPQKQFILIIF